MIGLLSSMVFAAQAAEISKANNSIALNEGVSWVNNIAPTTTDSAVYSGFTDGIANSLGANQSWLGFMVTNSGTVLISGTGDTLTIGSGDITGYGSGNIYFKPKLNQSGNATYNFGGKLVWIDGGLGGSGNITKNGSGNMIISGSNAAFSGHIDFGGGTLSVNHDEVLGAGVLTLSGDFRTAQNRVRVNGNKKGVFTRDRQPKMAAHFIRKKWAAPRYL